MNRTYRTITEVTDYGPFITKIILPLPQNVKSEDIALDAFNIYVERRDKRTGEILQLRKDWFSEELFPSKGYCSVKNAYSSDEEGNKVEEGSFIVLEPAFGPEYPFAAEIAPVAMHNVYVYCDFRITQVKELPSEGKGISGLVFDHFSGGSCRQTEGWINCEAAFEDIPFRYGFFTPRIGCGVKPLIIWLHGAGEGGFDASIAYTGNRVVSLAADNVQSLFGGAYVLAPQIATMWMDDGEGIYTRSGKSKYVTALKALIDEFVKLHSDIDANRIYIGGCSNGGFMTMKMILDYPEFFAAAYPVCEALYDETISDEKIEAAKNVPIWFTHAKNDPIVKPEETVLPTYQRLIGAGADNVHFTFFDRVVDTTGRFVDAKGKPYEFNGHFSWIPMLNDECRVDFDGQPVWVNGKEVTLLTWLSMQSRDRR